MARKDWTHCVHGHEFTPENTHVRTDGKRQCRACASRRSLAYHFKNREKKLADYAAYRVANREDILAREAVYRVLNREAGLHREHRRRAGAEGAADSDTLDYMKVIVLDPCSYCGTASKDFDHIESLSASGDHHWSNLTRACRACNASKSAKPVLLWMATRSGTPAAAVDRLDLTEDVVA